MNRDSYLPETSAIHSRAGGMSLEYFHLKWKKCHPRARGRNPNIVSTSTRFKVPSTRPRPASTYSASRTAQALHMPPARPVQASSLPAGVYAYGQQNIVPNRGSARLARGLPAGSTYVRQGGTTVGVDVNNERGHAHRCQHGIALFPVARQL